MADAASASDRAPLLLRSPSLRSVASTLGPASSHSSSHHGSTDSAVRRRTQFLRTMSFIAALLAALCAGSITVFSLYGPMFQSRLRFTQFEINGVASAMSISLYVPVPLIGYLCDRAGPSMISLASAFLLGGGYGLAAGLYRKGDVLLGGADGHKDNSVFPFMVLAFVLVGMGTACLYVASITTCAKNFGKGKYRGLMLVAPIATLGFSGVLISQLASRLLFERLPDGAKGDFNVFHFFLMLAVFLGLVGIFGTFALRIVDEDELINEAVEELERSGLLEGSQIFRRLSSRSGYSATADVGDAEDAGILDPAKDDQDDDDNAMFKKSLLLNAETRRFLSDHTMWWFALGFWLIIGPGEAFINNFGTVIGTLHSPGSSDLPTSAATHVSIIAATNTVARLVVGSLSDFVSPKPHSPHPQAGLLAPPPPPHRFAISRVAMIVCAGLVISFGTLFMATGAAQDHADRFWVVSGFIGAGYGGLFSLMPIIVTIIWGVENFGTNFGIVALFPAIGSTMWGLIYSAVYEAGANDSPSASDGSNEDVFCYGTKCYATAFWAMTASIWTGCLMMLWAWKGKDGWVKRGVVI